MKKLLFLFCAGLLCGNLLAVEQGKIENVTARQRYPWNGLVDINCTLSGDEGGTYALKVSAKDKVGGTNLVVNAVSVEGGAVTNNPVSTSLGDCHLVWNAGVDLPDGFRSDQVAISVTVQDLSKKFMVVDLSTGEVSYVADAPEDGWADDPYKITKMVFQRIEATTFVQLIKGFYTRKVTLTKPFYIAIYPLTEGQVATIQGKSSTSTSLATYHAKEVVHYTTMGADLRGDIYGNTENSWPARGHTVSDSSLIGKLRAKTISKSGVSNFDIPTLAQMCLASTLIDWNSEGCLAIDNYQLDLGEADAVDPVGPLCYSSQYSYAESLGVDRCSQTLVYANQQWCETASGAYKVYPTRLCFYDAE